MILETPYSKYLSNPTLEGAIFELDDVLKTRTYELLNLEQDKAEPDRASDRWSRQEILGHLIDSALNNHQRFVRAQIPAHLSHGALVIDGYAQNDWVRVGAYNTRDLKALASLWSGLNTQILHVMRTVNPLSLQTNIVIGGGAPVTLEAVMVDYVGHVKHHLSQILE